MRGFDEGAADLLGFLRCHEDPHCLVLIVVQHIFDLLQKVGVEMPVFENDPAALGDERLQILLDVRLADRLGPDADFLFVPVADPSFDVHSCGRDDQDRFLRSVVDEGTLLLEVEFAQPVDFQCFGEYFPDHVLEVVRSDDENYSGFDQTLDLRLSDAQDLFVDNGVGNVVFDVDSRECRNPHLFVLLE